MTGFLIGVGLALAIHAAMWFSVPRPTDELELETMQHPEEQS